LPRLLVTPAVVSITPSGIDLTVVVSGEVGASVAFVAFVASVVVVGVVVEIVVVDAVVVETVVVAAVVETVVVVVGVVVGADVVDEEVVTAGTESVVFDIWDPSVAFVRLAVEGVDGIEDTVVTDVEDSVGAVIPTEELLLSAVGTVVFTVESTATVDAMAVALTAVETFSVALIVPVVVVATVVPFSVEVAAVTAVTSDPGKGGPPGCSFVSGIFSY
jgi:hypothetical protein